MTAADLDALVYADLRRCASQPQAGHAMAEARRAAEGRALTVDYLEYYDRFGEMRWDDPRIDAYDGRDQQDREPPERELPLEYAIHILQELRDWCAGQDQRATEFCDLTGEYHGAVRQALDLVLPMLVAGPEVLP